MSTYISRLKAMGSGSTSQPEQKSSDESLAHGEVNYVTELDVGSKRLGIFSCIGLICNRMLGTGVFAVSSTIYTLCGSIGLALIMWAAGAIIAMSGLYVYLEFGSAIPRNGGEKNYLEHIFKKPRFFITSMYASYVFFLGWAASNSVNAAVMFLTAADVDITTWKQRGVALGVLTFCFAVNAVNVKLGLYIQNVLGIFKVGIVIFISVTGWVVLGKKDLRTDNFHNAFEGTGNATAYGVVNALYNVIWSFIGYSNVNYALGEVKNPVRTLKIAGPVSMVFLAIVYIFVNIAYFAAVPKDKLKSSKLILAADFFDIVFGGQAKKAASVIVGLSAVGNVMSVIFSQGRIIQQLGREGVLPFSSFFATSKPFDSPLVGLLQHFIVCVVTIIAPPPGDAYNFILNLISYPMNVINFAVSAGLLWIYWQRRQNKIEWNPSIRAGVIITTFFMLSNIYLVVAPYVPPSDGGEQVYSSLPYWTHCVVTWGIFAIGAIYWLVWSRILPKIGKYELLAVEVVGEDGFWRKEIIKRKLGADDDYATENVEVNYTATEVKTESDKNL
ncbi:LAME_0A02718g1_1 [Lachancea meyersii CBS 8951]|uniref:LAME_0A02718g1_1 n=1 Tax=Lachancea meyersii CBS 8951 TaxID=1266667 RepID=A0A1G4IMX0_9SACH|nr:LAME_0A02718g1_1 [Lachancea meyersii CBS 8951]